MKELTACNECGGRRAVVDVNITTPLTEFGKSWELQLEQRNRGIGFLGLGGKSNVSTMFAVSCTQCGKTTLYAAEPGNLQPDE